jgi:glycosyltransferase involved in cell wall biosynthesis
MKISFGLPKDMTQDNVWAGNGYGYATRMIMNSLSRLGYDWSENDDGADVELWFDQPRFWRPSKDKYVVGYHPWESTLLPPGWADIMNQCDEIWTPSPVIADWYHQYAGITRPVYVFEHGVSPGWTPVERKFSEPFSYLHLGGEALRKGMKDALAGFRDAFPGPDNVELNLKMTSEGWNHSGWHRVNILPKSIDVTELIELYHGNHVYVYPSWGEGFGLTPLQALATGMPTITLSSWAPYARFLDPNLIVGSRLSPPPSDDEHPNANLWRTIHPGQMWRPNRQDLAHAIRYAFENYEDCVTYAMDQTDEIRRHYDWDRLTEEAFENLKMRL